ncbi:SdpI family protein [Corynebacterium glyciniphilum]|uniref:SdpI family protein n=1 Tax=Corynebacterium glyciniphilum TaxID=1404244 RepID=UPI0011AB2FDD|nr:SdpI family protein [Corynebacterium glyciniphilum]
MPEVVIFALLIVVVGGLTLWWARACQRGTVRQNFILGYRTPYTLRNQDAWVAAHKAYAPYAYTAGTGTIGAASAGVIAGLLSFDVWGSVLVGGGVIWLIFWILVGGFATMVAVSRHKRARTDQKGDS